MGDKKAVTSSMYSLPAYSFSTPQLKVLCDIISVCKKNIAFPSSVQLSPASTIRAGLFCYDCYLACFQQSFDSDRKENLMHFSLLS